MIKKMTTQERFDKQFETIKNIDGDRKYWKIYKTKDRDTFRLSDDKFFPQDIL